MIIIFCTSFICLLILVGIGTFFINKLQFISASLVSMKGNVNYNDTALNIAVVALHIQILI